MTFKQKQNKHRKSSLEQRNDIVIRPADKGGGLVVLSKAYYHEEMCRLLGDRSTYLLLRGDPMVQFKNELHLLIKEGKETGILDKKEAAYLDPFYCRTPIIYFSGMMQHWHRYYGHWNLLI